MGTNQNPKHWNVVLGGPEGEPWVERDDARLRGYSTWEGAEFSVLCND